MDRGKTQFSKTIIDHGHKINIHKLGKLMHDGQAILQRNFKNQDAVMIIGDSGVGKSTVLSFLRGQELIVDEQNLNMILRNKDKSKLNIGHDKISHTTVPQKGIINHMAFYDCPGFSDNKGQQFEISNAFFVKRLFSSHKNIKILLLISYYQYLKESRLKSFPILIENLEKFFGNLEGIKDGIIILVTKADRRFDYDQYEETIYNIIDTKIDGKLIIGQKRKEFIQYLLRKKRILFFRQPSELQKGKKFIPDGEENQIITKLKRCDFIQKTKLNIILSHKSQLVMNEMIFQITRQTEIISKMIQVACDKYAELEINKVGNNIQGIRTIKRQIQKFRQNIHDQQQEEIISFLQRIFPKNNKQYQHVKTDIKIMLTFYKLTEKSKQMFNSIKKMICKDIDELIQKIQEWIKKKIDSNHRHENILEKKKHRNDQFERQLKKLHQHKHQLKHVKQENNLIHEQINNVKHIFQHEVTRKIEQIEKQIEDFDRKRDQEIEQIKKMLREHE